MHPVDVKHNIPGIKVSILYTYIYINEIPLVMQKKSRVDYLIYIYIEWRFINSFQKIKKNNGEAINNEHRLIS